MELITGTTQFYLESDTAVAIGKFDGVHIGHRRLLEEILAQKERGLASCVFTFEPFPEELFGHGAEPFLRLNSREEKRRLLERMGVDFLIEYPLTRESAAVSPEDFLRDMLGERLGARFVAAGPDLSFGAGGRGDFAMLREYAERTEGEARLVEKVKVSLEGFPEEQEVSSSLLRELVLAARMEDAERLLGIPYPVFGRVAHGRGLGHTLGFPTLNLLPDAGKLLPPNGVYESEVRTGERTYRGITNLGTAPTVSGWDGAEGARAETYLYDFSGDLYGAEIEVYLKRFLRPERKFESVEALKAQLRRDIGAAQDLAAESVPEIRTGNL